MELRQIFNGVEVSGMQIREIGVNTARVMATERSIRENGNPAQPPESSMFGPEYEVTISEEGRNLSGQQAAQTETDIRGTQSGEEVGILFSQLEKDTLAEKTRQGYYSELEEIEKQIKVLNAAYGSMNEEAYKEAYEEAYKKYGGSLKQTVKQQKETVEQLRELKEEIQKQEELQMEAARRRLEEAQQIVAMQSAQYKEEIDENNRDLVALLKTVEEAEKAEDEQENGGSKEDGDSASGTGNSASDAIHNSAAGLMKSSLNREKGVEELSNRVADSGQGFLNEANVVMQNLLEKSIFIKEAIDDKSFTNGQIDEMMRSFRSEVKSDKAYAYILGSFGTQALRDMRDIKIQHIAGNPLQSMQQTKDGMMRAAASAALGEARKSSLDKASKELADEVEKLIDERNNVDGVQQDKKEEDEEEQGRNGSL